MRLFAIFLFCLFTVAVYAQTDSYTKPTYTAPQPKAVYVTTTPDTTLPVKIAVFAPLYIDSTFKDQEYKTEFNNMLPKVMIPGLEFYNGVMMAIDSLQSQHANIEVLIFDLKNSKESLAKILSKPVWDSVTLIISSFNGRLEIKPLADLALKKNIPLISSTYPNDGGVNNNPFFVLINSTLRTHCDGLYKHMQRNYATSNLIYVTKKGNTEQSIANVFKEIGKATSGVALKYKTIELTDSFYVNQLVNNLDSTRQNIIFCGSLNEEFGLRVIKALNSSKKYPSTAIGMPTWDGIKELSSNDITIETIYSTPYNFNRKEKLGMSLIYKFKSQYNARPSDVVFKGFESMYHFGSLAAKYRIDFINHLSDKDFKIFNDFDIQPVKFNKTNIASDYMENKKLYFIKRSSGVVKSVN